MQGKVLVIEDEAELGELVKLYLAREGIDGSLCGTAEDALALFRKEPFDLVVLDINLPGMDGFEFLQELRRESPIPVVIVSARESDEDIVMGLGMGADEFVSKPFAPRVLMARIRALLRRVRSLRSAGIEFGPFSLDPEGFALFRDGERIILSTKEFEVLRFLVMNPGKAMTSEEIYSGVWGSEYGDTTAVAVYVRRIRQKIGDDPANPRYVQTIHGSGYRFNPETLKGA